ncbi:hypothetical protein NC653_008756 [Populus alba x Populus x berolinensis]|uniref:Uncharacterized protein n=1 Tax=Populus alba x Populus x berolinensis TaxID=444605 RepID=A0AAD6R7B3_9ROSI|nr:hypothetical protein NC653_008756 [Populus alba x Populus x berolinensis]
MKGSMSTSIKKKRRRKKHHAEVIGYYKNKGAVAELHAEKSPKEVTAEVQKVLSL